MIDVAELQELKQWATPRQIEYIDAIIKTGSYRKAAALLGVDKDLPRKGVNRVKLKAAQQGYSPSYDMTKTVPEGYMIKGVSTLYNSEGQVTAQWVKSQVDSDKQRQLFQEAFEAMASDLPRLPAISIPKDTINHLATVYTLSDAHVGALAWHAEGGEDWDLDIAESTLTKCFNHLIQSSPDSRVGIIAQLGDFLHQDNINPLTPTSGNLLDADGRFSKVVAIGVKILRNLVSFALKKHEKVVVLLAEGNHDISSSIWLRTMFKALYENEPRIEVIDSVLPYYVYQHGKTMLGWHHGHMKKNDQLPLLFAAQYPQIWGNTLKRYVHTGHKHHSEEKEHSGITVIQHPTLAARDAHSSRHGYLSERQTNAITYHTEYGQVGKVFVTPEMVN